MSRLSDLSAVNPRSHVHKEGKHPNTMRDKLESPRSHLVWGFNCGLAPGACFACVEMGKRKIAPFKRDDGSIGGLKSLSAI